MKRKSRKIDHRQFDKETNVTKTNHSKQIWTYYFRVGAVIAAALTYYVMFFGPSSAQTVFAPSKINLPSRCINISCSDDYLKHPFFQGCTPNKMCGRCVKDGLLTENEVKLLKKIAQNGLAYGGSSGGASILDLHSGALSKEDKFINIYKYLTKDKLLQTFSKSSIDAYIRLKNKIHATIADHFGIDPASLYLTKPTFFSRMTATPAKTKHDQYWHTHIDKIQYGSFDYTALIYLATYGEDFEGGQFVFNDPLRNVTVQPKSGRVSFFTSGSENPHHVEKVLSGTRFALTIAFTCDPTQAIQDPSFY